MYPEIMKLTILYTIKKKKKKKKLITQQNPIISVWNRICLKVIREMLLEVKQKQEPIH